MTYQSQYTSPCKDSRYGFSLKCKECDDVKPVEDFQVVYYYPICADCWFDSPNPL